MMSNKVETASKQPEAEDKCRHYWIIESPNGPTSQGVCQFCGAVKDFYNSPPEFWSGRRRSEGFKPPEETTEKEDDSNIAPG